MSERMQLITHWKTVLGCFAGRMCMTRLYINFSGRMLISLCLMSHWFHAHQTCDFVKARFFRSSLNNKKTKRDLLFVFTMWRDKQMVLLISARHTSISFLKSSWMRSLGGRNTDASFLWSMQKSACSIIMSRNMSVMRSTCQLK